MVMIVFRVFFGHKGIRIYKFFLYFKIYFDISILKLFENIKK
jgi:hypothetical protein